MKQFKIIYRILRILQKAMDAEEFDAQCIGAEALGISAAMWARILKMLVMEGYVEGVYIVESEAWPLPQIYMPQPEITLKGLEYLEENAMMAKAARLAKEISDMIP